MKLRDPPLWLWDAIVVGYFILGVIGVVKNPNDVFWWACLFIGTLWLAVVIYDLKTNKFAKKPTSSLCRWNRRNT